MSLSETVDARGYVYKERLGSLIFDQAKAIRNLHMAKPLPISVGSMGSSLELFFERRLASADPGDKGNSFLTRVSGRFAKSTGRTLELDSEFLIYIFLSPKILARFAVANLRQCDDYRTSIARADPIQARNEYLFNIGVIRGEGIIATPVVEHNCDGAIVTNYHKLNSPGFHQMVAVHTHPPRSRLVRPSVLTENVQYKGDVGDLFYFAACREFRNKAKDAFGRFSVNNRLLQIIIQTNMAIDTVKMLFIQEGPQLPKLSYPDYLQMLRDLAPKIHVVSDQQSIIDNLRNANYRVSYLELDFDNFFHYPVFGDNALEVPDDLDLPR